MPKILESYWKTGVYELRNLVNNKCYVGGAYKSFSHRIRIHLRDLRQDNHGNKHLQASWNKYGSESFQFFILERCSPEDCATRETWWIAERRATEKGFGYNKSPTGGSPLGKKHPPEYGKAVSERNKKMSAETKAKIGASSKGRVQSPEAIEKHAAKLRGKKRPPEVIAKIAAALKGKKRTGIALENIKAGVRSRELTPELRKKLGNGNRGRKQSTLEILKRRMANLGKKRTPTQCQRIGNSLKGKKRSPEAVLASAEGLRKTRATETKEDRKKYGAANIGINRRLREVSKDATDRQTEESQ